MEGLYCSDWWYPCAIKSGGSAKDHPTASCQVHNSPNKPIDDSMASTIKKEYQFYITYKLMELNSSEQDTCVLNVILKCFALRFYLKSI